MAQCGPLVPTFTVDLSSSPNATWLSPTVARNDTCCGATNPDKCIQFIVTLHPAAQGIIFNISSGAIPPGAIFYQVACGPPTPVGDAICLSGAGPHVITFCKPGNNNNTYSITAVSDPGVGPSIAINDGCSGVIKSIGYEPTSIIWTSISPGAVGAYDGYLSCTAGCDSATVTAQVGFPAYVDYQICGLPLGGCDTVPTCDTVRAFFNSTLGANILPVNPTVCFGTAGTTITANGVGGTPPYTYLWSTGATSASIFVNVGTYTVTLGDSSGCPPTYDTVVVTAFSSTITANAGTTQTVCSANIPIQLGGVITAASGGIWSGGTGAYNPGSTDLNAQYTPSNTEISNGSATLYLTSTGNGTCPSASDTVTFSIVDFNATPTLTVTNVSCFGGTDGAVSISLAGGVTPYTAVWGTIPIQTGLVATNLVAGTYSVTITDGNGCDSVTSLSITQPTVLTSNISDSSSVSCFGGTNGTATVQGLGGTLPYSYLWDVNAVNQTTSMATGLTQGSYSVTVTDNNGCTSISTVTITQPLLALSGVATVSNITCFGLSNGSSTVVANGGTSPYTYSWSASTGNQNTSFANNLSLGTHSVIITDSLGCTFTVPIIITQPLPVNVTSLSNTNVNCFGGAGASATATPTGGTAPYTFQWDVAAGSQTTNISTGLGAGVYGITITDSNGCVFDTVVVITQPISALNDSTNVTGVSCFGGNNGTATVIGNGGTTPYTYQWNVAANSQTTNTATSLSAGTYLVVVTDSNACRYIDSVTIIQPTLLLSSISNTVNVSCNSGANGSASVSASGGVLPYTYLWSSNANNQTSSTASGLVAGSYSVTITDSNNCVSTTTVIITEPQFALSGTMAFTDATCYGLNNGTATVTPTGGTSPYSYLWSANAGAVITSTATNLLAGTYSVVITDSNGCVFTVPVTISQPSALFITGLSNVPVSCFGGNNATASVTVNGGTIPYTYFWGGIGAGQTSNPAIGLSSGTCLITVTDANGCTIDTSLIISQPLQALNVSINSSAVACFGGNDGSANASTTGGTSPYNYQWGSGAGFAITSSINNLFTGGYFVTVTDSKGCIDSSWVNINQPSNPLSGSMSVTNATCFGYNNGTASVRCNGGTPGYSYVWGANTNYQTNLTAIGLLAGTYNVTITDANGCLDSAVVNITEPNPIFVTASPNDSICPASPVDIKASATGGNGGYVYLWNHGLLDLSVQTVNPVTSTTYIVSVTDSNSCPGAIDSTNIYVYTLFPSTLETTHTGDICPGENTIVQASYSPGFGIHTYFWDNGLGSGLGPHTVSPTTTTTYILLITDQCGNSIADSVKVTVYPVPQIALPTLIDNGCDPLTVNFVDTINSNSLFTYLWDFGDGTTSSLSQPSYTYTGEGTYFVKLKLVNDFGCETESDGLSKVIVRPSPFADFTASLFVSDLRNPTIDFEDLSTGASSLIWYFDLTDTSTLVNPSFTYPDTGTYSVKLWVVNQYGCTDEIVRSILIEPYYTFDVPNAFVPNAEGGSGGYYDPASLSNEVFYAISEYVDDFHMLVFNRWGELVFESFDINIGWDGYYRGELSAQDAYVWKIDITYVDGQRFTQAGDVSLIR